MDIEINGKVYRTLDTTYTLLHLFLSAFSNSTDWYRLNSNGLRDMYEIMLFVKKYDVNYKDLHAAADLHGICPIIQGIMNKINRLFGRVFDDNNIALFNTQTRKTHMIAKLYEHFLQFYTIDYIKELKKNKMKLQ